MASVHKRGKYWMIRWRDANGDPKGETIKIKNADGSIRKVTTKSEAEEYLKQFEGGQLQVKQFLDELEDILAKPLPRRLRVKASAYAHLADPPTGRIEEETPQDALVIADILQSNEEADRVAEAELVLHITKNPTLDELWKLNENLQQDSGLYIEWGLKQGNRRLNSLIAYRTAYSRFRTVIKVTRMPSRLIARNR